MIIIALLALAGLVIAGLNSGSSDVAYQNDNYQVPPPDENPPPIPVPQTYEEAEQLITNNPFYAQTVPVPVRDRKSTRLNSSHTEQSRMPSSA